MIVAVAFRTDPMTTARLSECRTLLACYSLQGLQHV